MPHNYAPLPRQIIQIDKRGRVTIPEYLREAADLKLNSWIEVEAYPDLEGCKVLTIKRAFK